MDTKGGKLRWGGNGGVLNWAIGIDMYTLMCIKLMSDLKKNSAHYGRDAKLQWIQKYVTRPYVHNTIQRVNQNCMICAKNKPKDCCWTSPDEDPT